MLPDKTKPETTRRTEGLRTAGRAARVVTEVLRRTAEELSRVGYAALRVDDVAALSGVNKTTIYRRWPTRADLVAAALRQAKAAPVEDTGSFEGDVLDWLRRTRAFACSTLGAGIIRVIQTERGHPELEPIAHALRQEHRQLRRSIINRAIVRGELPRGASINLVEDLVFCSAMTRLVSYGEPVTDAYMRRLLRIVVEGATAEHGRASSSTHAPVSRGPVESATAKRPSTRERRSQS